jgi:hypothetical protein
MQRGCSRAPRLDGRLDRQSLLHLREIQHVIEALRETKVTRHGLQHAGLPPRFFW